MGDCNIYIYIHIINSMATIEAYIIICVYNDMPLKN